MLRFAALLMIGIILGAAVMFALAGPGSGPTPTAGEMRASTSGDIRGTGLPMAGNTIAGIDAGVARRPLELVAAGDPLAALALVETLAGPERLSLRYALDAEWARLDTAGYLAYVQANPHYLETLTGRGFQDPDVLLERSDGLRLLIASDPESVIALADRLSSRLGTIVRGLAISALAESDPFGAIAMAERIPPGLKRSEAIAAVAEGFARNDAEAALAWAQGLAPVQTEALRNVVRVMSRQDIGRSVDLALQFGAGGGSPQFAFINTVIATASEDSTQARLVADRLFASAASNRDGLIDQLLGRWAESDPAAVFAWVSANAAGLGADALSGAAYTIAAQDAAAAAAYTEQVPFELREEWIDSVAQGYATADPAGALEWISRYAGEPGYDVGLRRVLTYYASSDPPAAARALASASAEVQLGAAGTVADNWARQDGAAAAEWARGLSNQEARAAAVPEAVGAWMSRSSQAAEDWTLGLPAGADRDEALYVILRGRLLTESPRSSYSNNPSAQLIEQIASPSMRAEIERWYEEAPDHAR